MSKTCGECARCGKAVYSTSLKSGCIPNGKIPEYHFKDEVACEFFKSEEEAKNQTCEKCKHIVKGEIEGDFRCEARNRRPVWKEKNDCDYFALDPLKQPYTIKQLEFIITTIENEGTYQGALTAFGTYILHEDYFVLWRGIERITFKSENPEKSAQEHYINKMKEHLIEKD